MKKLQTRLYKVTNHTTGIVRLISAYNKWQATEYCARDDYSAEVVKASEAVRLTGQGLQVEEAVFVKGNKHEPGTI